VCADLLQDVVHALVADVGEVLADCGEWGSVRGGLGHVVEPDRTDVFRNRFSLFVEGAEQAEGHVVVRGAHGRAAGLVGEPEPGDVGQASLPGHLRCLNVKLRGG